MKKLLCSVGLVALIGPIHAYAAPAYCDAGANRDYTYAKTKLFEVEPGVDLMKLIEIWKQRAASIATFSHYNCWVHDPEHQKSEYQSGTAQDFVYRYQYGLETLSRNVGSRLQVVDWQPPAQNTNKSVQKTANQGQADPTRQGALMNKCIVMRPNVDGSLTLANTCEQELIIAYCYSTVDPQSTAGKYRCSPSKSGWSPTGTQYFTQFPGALKPGGDMNVGMSNQGPYSVHWIACAPPYIFPVLGRYDPLTVERDAAYCIGTK